MCITAGVYAFIKKQKEVNMKLNFSDIKSKLKLGQNGSPILAIILFVVAFSITISVLGGGSKSNISSFELGEKMRAAVDSEDGEIVATINDVNYYEKDLEIVKLNMIASYPKYFDLSEKQQRDLAGDQLVRHYMLIQEFERLGLSVTEEECDAYIEEERSGVIKLLADEDANGKSFLEYVEGYGCSFEDYWQDKDTRASYAKSLKYNKAHKEISRLNDKDSMSEIEMNSYLTELIKDGTYTITLFGEPFGTK